MARSTEVEAGNEYESTHNGNTYTVQRIEGNKVQLASPQTGASWHSLDKVKDDIENGVLN
jgi:hypothetical protein